MSDSNKSSEQLRVEFGQWLKGQRRAAGLVQEVLAKAAPIDRVHLARIESGESGTKRDTVISLVEAINHKSTTGHKVDMTEAIERFYGRWLNPNTKSQTLDRKPRNPQEFFELLESIGLDINLAGGSKSLQGLDEDDLQELIDSAVANASAKVKRKLKEVQAKQ